MKKYKLIKKYPGCVYQLNQVINTDFIWINTIRTDLKDYPEYWQELKNPIFTTDDNVPIFIGDSFFYVYPNGEIRCFPCTTVAPVNRELVYFSTEKAAEVYVEQQKKYCTNDREPIKRSQKFYIFDDKYYKCMEAKAGCFKSSKWHGKRYKTKEEVERLIALKKPQYSVEDIVDIVNIWSMCRVSEEDILKKLER